MDHHEILEHLAKNYGFCLYLAINVNKNSTQIRPTIIEKTSLDLPSSQHDLGSRVLPQEGQVFARLSSQRPLLVVHEADIRHVCKFEQRAKYENEAAVDPDVDRFQIGHWRQASVDATGLKLTIDFCCRRCYVSSLSSSSTDRHQKQHHHQRRSCRHHQYVPHHSRHC